MKIVLKVLMFATRIRANPLTNEEWTTIAFEIALDEHIISWLARIREKKHTGLLLFAT